MEVRGGSHDAWSGVSEPTRGEEGIHAGTARVGHQNHNRVITSYIKFHSRLIVELNM